MRKESLWCTFTCRVGSRHVGLDIYCGKFTFSITSLLCGGTAPGECLSPPQQRWASCSSPEDHACELDMWPMVTLMLHQQGRTCCLY